MTNFDQWIERAKYDFDAAKDMFNTKKYDYTAFFCHQTIEKAIKGYYLFSQKKMAPYIHNLIKLAKESNIYNEIDNKNRDFLEDLNPCYIELRYPAIDRAFDFQIDELKAKEFLLKAEEFLEWLELKMKS